MAYYYGEANAGESSIRQNGYFKNLPKWAVTAVYSAGQAQYHLRKTAEGRASYEDAAAAEEKKERIPPNGLYMPQ